MSEFAKVIIDISAEAVDRTFTYRIPGELSGKLRPGMCVKVPFGSAKRAKNAYVTELCGEADYAEDKIREIEGIAPRATGTDGEMIALAAFLSREYGSTMNQALKMVLPVKRTVRKNRRRTDPAAKLEQLSAEAEPKQKAELPVPNREQQAIISDLCLRYEEYEKKQDAKEPFPVSLLHGVTGSGKTLIYIKLIEEMQRRGKKSIVLIPEISLTYQTVQRLSAYFAGRIAVLHSRLSEGERFEQYQKALSGEIDVMVGPRSALFTPFEDLGLIIIDEEHERAYHSELSPRYDAREAARFRAEQTGAMLLLGSATPSLLSYSRAISGKYRLYELSQRAASAALPRVWLSDMRTELSEGNRTAFSGTLKQLMSDRLLKGEQTMLFLNRRGYAGFVSCRSCGHVIKCPHCDVSLTAHNNWYYDRAGNRQDAALLSCHYCGYTAPMPKLCPSCKSRHIAPFGTGTQKLEQAVKKAFPKARVLRMDADTTAGKGAHERILSSFQAGKADILIGTQMIVKGHDFPNVTLMGVIAADLSLFAAEYDAAERTFQLITQAAGRAGRAGLPGDVVIQSYDPSHYAVETAARQDYRAFYEREMSFRRLMKYPPFTEMLAVRFQSGNEALLEKAAQEAAAALSELARENGAELIGPCAPGLYKVNDNYRKILYIKHESHAIILGMREALKRLIAESPYRRELFLSYDLYR